MNKVILKKAIDLYNSGLTTTGVSRTLGIPQSIICNGKFKKGHIPWNKGKKMSLKTKEKLSKIKKKQIKKGIHIPPKFPVLHGKDHPYWKGGLPKCIDCGEQLTHYGKNKQETRCRKCSDINRRGENHHNWNGGSLKCKYCGKSLYSKARSKTKSCTECFWKYESKDVYNKRPTKPEKIVKKFLDKHFPKEWKYVGNGDFWLGRKNPDFMNINGEKKLIEVFGDYWHRGQTGEKRKKHFAKYGFETLIIWENECYKGEKYLYKKLINRKEEKCLI